MNPTNRAAAEIMEILLGLPSPRHAAAAIATVRANLFIGGGGDTEEKVKKMIADDNRAALDIWTTIGGAMASATNPPVQWPRH